MAREPLFEQDQQHHVVVTMIATKALTTRDLREERSGRNNLHRWFEPDVERWLNEDPIRFAARDANLYRYLGNSPTNYIDPTGLVGEPDFAWLFDPIFGPAIDYFLGYNDKGLADTGSQIIPGVSDLRDIQETLSGKDAITGKPLSRLQRAVTAGAAMLPVIPAKPFRKAAGDICGSISDAFRKGDAGDRAADVTGEVVEHSSQSAARRAARRDAGMGKHGGVENLPDQPLRPGSQSPTGPRGTRTEVRSTDTGDVVHHDPYGTRYDDGTVTPPHYGVDRPGQRTVHHTYPSPHDPKTNR